MPSLRKHPGASLAPDADADDVNLAADLDLDPAILVTAVGAPLLLGMRGLRKSHPMIFLP